MQLREDKNTNFELGSRRFTCFESRGYQAAVPEVKQEEQRGSRIRQTPKSCQPSREGREGGGRASLQRATCLHPCKEPLAFPRSCWCPGDREGSQPARLWPAEVQAGAGNHLAHKPNTLQKNSSRTLKLEWQEGIPLVLQVTQYTSQLMKNSKDFPDLKLTLIKELNESVKERDSNKIVLRILTKIFSFSPNAFNVRN